MTHKFKYIPKVPLNMRATQSDFLILKLLQQSAHEKAPYSFV